MQYSAIGIAPVFCIKKVFLRAEHGRRKERAVTRLCVFQQALVW